MIPVCIRVPEKSHTDNHQQPVCCRCPFSNSFLDGLQTTNHLIAHEIRNANLIELEELWKKVNMPTWMPGRGKLPVTCNREWFLEFFNVNVGDVTCTSSEIWKNSALYMYGECFSTSKDCHLLYFFRQLTPRLVVRFSRNPELCRGIFRAPFYTKMIRC
jgi:hypothetical protein